MPTLSMKVDTDTAAQFAAFAADREETVSSLLRSWIEAAVAGRWIELVDMRDDSHRGYVLVES